MLHIDFVKLQFAREYTSIYETLPETVKNNDQVEVILTEVLGLHKEVQEIFGIIALNNAQKVVGIHNLFKGTMTTTIAETKEAFIHALLNGASYIILYHNHPSGETEPSQEDIELTKRFVEAGKIIGVRVLDHVIIANDGKTTKHKSIRGLFPELFKN